MQGPLKLSYFDFFSIFYNLISKYSYFLKYYVFSVFIISTLHLFILYSIVFARFCFFSNLFFYIEYGLCQVKITLPLNIFTYY